MKRLALVSALMLAGAAMFAAPAAAQSVGFSFGYYGPDYPGFGDPCDYYDYYDEPPPWGLPPDYCDYPVYFEPIFIDGYWYRGPIYYRWYGGERMFWINGRWRRDEWRGARPAIRWVDRGGLNGGRGGHGYFQGGGTYYGNRGSYGNHGSGGQGGNWNGGNPYSGHGNWNGGQGGGNPYSGHGNLNGGQGGGHGWSGSGGGGNHGGSGGGRGSSGGGGGHGHGGDGGGPHH